jgi:hypothetical protein
VTAELQHLNQEVAGSRLATSAQPRRATSAFSPVVSSQPTPQPIRSFLLLDKPDALLEGLRCFTAFRPLPSRHLFSKYLRRTNQERPR